MFIELVLTKVESFPNVVIEASNAGIPSVCLQVPGGMSELFQLGSWGKLVSKADELPSAIKEMYSLDHQKRSQILSDAKEVFQNKAMRDYKIFFSGENPFQEVSKNLDQVIESLGKSKNSSSSISFNEGNRTFSISPSGTSFIVLLQGRQFRKTSTEQKQISNVEGIHYIYYDLDGVLQETTSFSVSLIEKYALVSITH
jgi:hypothetical protein